MTRAILRRYPCPAGRQLVPHLIRYGNRVVPPSILSGADGRDMPRGPKAAPARAAQAELARLMASIALGDELELEIEEAPAPRYLPPPLHAPATPIAEECSAAAPEVTPAQSDVSVSTAVVSDASPAASACSQRSSLSSPLSDSSELVDFSPAAEEATVLNDLPDDLLGWIFAFVHLEQLCRAARPVCHGWRGLVTVVIDTCRSLSRAPLHLVSQLTPRTDPCDTGAGAPGLRARALHMLRASPRACSAAAG